jgi:predicted nucleic-acid-binding protein
VRGLDTNVLMRSLTGDDPDQSPRANKFLEEAAATGECLYVSTVVLIELCWTLRSSPYHYTREAIADVVSTLLQTHLFEVQDRDLTKSAVADYRSGGGDLPDYLLGRQNRRAGCSDTVTFDRTIAKAQGFTLLSQ